MATGHSKVRDTFFVCYEVAYWEMWGRGGGGGNERRGKEGKEAGREEGKEGREEGQRVRMRQVAKHFQCVGVHPKRNH